MKSRSGISRTRLCVLMALILAVAAVGLMLTRHLVLGPLVRLPRGPEAWRVTMLVQGKRQGDARVVMTLPLENDRQHLSRETFASEEFAGRPKETQPGSPRSVIWTPKAGGEGIFRLRYDGICTLAAESSATRASQSTHPPRPGEHLRTESGIEVDAPQIAALARELTAGLDRPSDRAEALYRHVYREIRNEPSLVGFSRGGLECWKQGSGDSAAKSRLLTALLRNSGIAARLVTGLTLPRGDEQVPHVWVEAWIRDHWLALCPFYGHLGRVPRNYLVLGYDDTRLVRGRHVSGLHSAFLVDRVPASGIDPAELGGAQRIFHRASFHGLSLADRHLVEFLLLLPVAALIVCVSRVLIGVSSFGTFTPALIGLVFRDLASLPGSLVFLAVLLLGWRVRRGLDRFHLLQVPRMALMLSSIVCMLIAVVAIGSRFDLTVTRSLSLFPLVILTGMVERFWTLDEEDGAGSSFRTLLSTLAISAAVALVVSRPGLQDLLFHYPEALGLVMAGQLLLGRYTGYRLLELYRFRDFLALEPRTTPPTAPVAVLAARVRTPEPGPGANRLFPPEA